MPEEKEWGRRSEKYPSTPECKRKERTKEPGENSAPTFHRSAAWLGQGGVVTVEKMGRDREREEGARGRPSFSPWLFWRVGGSGEGILSSLSPPPFRPSARFNAFKFARRDRERERERRSKETFI